MTGYRILRDENVDPQTVRYLERDGHDAEHVGDTLGLGTDDRIIAQYAVEQPPEFGVDNRVLLTNDTDFLDAERYPDISVLLFTNNRAGAYELASMVGRLTSYYPDQDDLPREFYLSEWDREAPPGEPRDPTTVSGPLSSEAGEYGRPTPRRGRPTDNAEPPDERTVPSRPHRVLFHARLLRGRVRGVPRRPAGPGTVPRGRSTLPGSHRPPRSSGWSWRVWPRFRGSASSSGSVAAVLLDEHAVD